MQLQSVNRQHDNCSQSNKRILTAVSFAGALDMLVNLSPIMAKTTAIRKQKVLTVNPSHRSLSPRMLRSGILSPVVVCGCRSRQRQHRLFLQGRYL
jgi:hypothetical protein